jgi:ABC-2 type transport system permease protein
MADVSSWTAGASAPVVRPVAGFNARGCWALFGKEVLRFLKIFPQTVLSPVVMSLLFFAVFQVGPKAAGAGDPTYPAFLATGLVMMAVLQNAFFNSAGALILSKIQGNIVDLIMAPLSPVEWTLAYGMAGVVRGLVVGIVSVAALAFFVDLPLASVGVAFFFCVFGSLVMALIGFVVGLWGDSFDAIGTVQNFVIMPATFLSGTFFPISSLPGVWGVVGRCNPFFYLIDGFRYGFLGQAEGSPWVGGVVLLVVTAALFALSVRMVAKGSTIKK